MKTFSWVLHTGNMLYMVCYEHLRWSLVPLIGAWTRPKDNLFLQCLRNSNSEGKLLEAFDMDFAQ